MAFTKFVLVLWKQGELGGPPLQWFLSVQTFSWTPSDAALTPQSIRGIKPQSSPWVSNPEAWESVSSPYSLQRACKMLGNDPCGGFYILVSKCVLSPLKFQSTNPHPHSWGGFRKYEKTFPPNDSLPRAQVPVLTAFVCLLLYLYLLPYFILRILDCHFGSLAFSIQKVFCRHFPSAEVFLIYLWGGRWSPLIPPLSWKSPPSAYF